MLLDTPVCEFGLEAPDFNLADPDGKTYSLADVMGEKGLLVAFICNHCPYVQAIIERLAADAKILQSEGVGVVAIMSNHYQDYPADRPEKMKEFAAEHGLTFPYLVDETQEVGRAYDAVCTPDFFGYNADGQLQYRGRLDDIKMNQNADGRTPELLNAMHLVVETGRGPEVQTPSMGCSIKWR